MDIGNHYSFDTLAPAILGASVKGAKLLAVLDYDTACLHEHMLAKFRKIYPVLPTGTPNDPAATKYYRFKSQSGEYIVIADCWINQSTIVEIISATLKVTISDCTVDDVSKVRNALNALGFKSFTIEQV